MQMLYPLHRAGWRENNKDYGRSIGPGQICAVPSARVLRRLYY